MKAEQRFLRSGLDDGLNVVPRGSRGRRARPPRPVREQQLETPEGPAGPSRGSLSVSGGKTPPWMQTRPQHTFVS